MLLYIAISDTSHHNPKKEKEGTIVGGKNKKLTNTGMSLATCRTSLPSMIDFLSSVLLRQSNPVTIAYVTNS
jgi:hypothetical protein